MARSLIGSARTAAGSRTAVSISRARADNLLVQRNWNMENVPGFVAAQTASNFMNGTATGSATNPAYSWIGAALASTRTAQFDTTVSHSGSASIKLTQTGTSTAFGISTGSKFVSGTTTPLLQSCLIPVSPSTSYTFSAWLKQTILTGHAGGFSIQWWEYDNLSSTSYNGTSHQTSGADGNYDWTKLSQTFTTGSGTNAIVVFIEFVSTDNTSFGYIDDVFFGPAAARSAA